MEMIKAPDMQEDVTAVAVIVHTANELTIENRLQLEQASGILGDIKHRLRIIDSKFDEPIKQAHATHKSMLALKNETKKPGEQAEKIIKDKVRKFYFLEDAKRAEEEERLRKETKAKEEERKLVEAARLEEEGEPEAAEAVLETKTFIPAPVVEAPPKVEGVSMRKIWKWRVSSNDAVPRAWLVLNEKAIGQHARSLGENANIPGIEFYEESSVAVTG